MNGQPGAENCLTIWSSEQAIFPQHLTAALRATCQVLCRHREGGRPQAVISSEIVDHFERNKDDYYAKRVGDELRLHRIALGALVRVISTRSLHLA